MASLESDADLDKALANANGAVGVPSPTGPDKPLPRSYLTSISVEGFRGIGLKSVLTLPTGPGVTLVIGRNGSGKSSFAEALETLLTGESSRWQERSAVWQEGWRNLHHGDPAQVEANFAVEGESALVSILRRWRAQDEDVSLGSATARVRGSEVAFDDLGWGSALLTFPPFLPYNKLGTIPDAKPSELFDEMSRALGLEPLVVSRERLRQRRAGAERAVRDAGNALKPILTQLAVLEDDRAVESTRFLRANPPDLDAVELVLEGAIGQEDSVLHTVQRLSALPEIDFSALNAAVEAVRVAGAEALAVEATDAGRALQLVEILQHALDFHAAHGDQPCPVCGASEIGSLWREHATVQVEDLKVAASAASQANQQLRAALDAGRALIVAVPDAVRRGSEQGLDVQGLGLTSLLALWEDWAVLWVDASAEDLCIHLLEKSQALSQQILQTKSAASVEVERRQDVWRPVAALLRGWLPSGRAAQQASEIGGPLKTAETWLATAIDDIRAERFEPIAERATEIWNHLRQSSSVSLDGLALAGSETRRHLDVQVTVDGVAGAALGVMSQGEIHSLALSLFLPRTMLPENPLAHAADAAIHRPDRAAGSAYR